MVHELHRSLFDRPDHNGRRGHQLSRSDRQRGPQGIAVGADGALWFTNVQGNTIGRITTAGVATSFSNPDISNPSQIAPGPDGAMWFTNGASSIGRITTAGVVTTYTNASIAFPAGIAAGPDGAMWFTNTLGGTDGNGSIDRITTTGVVTSYDDPNIVNPDGIAAGPDGALWFTNTFGLTNFAIGRITTAGVITGYAANAYYPQGITTGPDGALWFTDSFGGQGLAGSVGRITTAGVATVYDEPAVNGDDRGIAAGPDGALWFGDPNSSIVRITTPASGNVWPRSGPAGILVNLSGGGFTAGESVSVSYKTGLAAPKTVHLCTASASTAGTFSCNTSIPVTGVGALGSHKIEVKGATSVAASTTFDLTTKSKKPKIKYQSNFTGSNEIITVDGSGFEPFSSDRVDVHDPVASSIHYAYPTASALGTFTVNVTIPEYACRGNVSIKALQLSPISATSKTLTDPAYC